MLFFSLQHHQRCDRFFLNVSFTANNEDFFAVHKVQDVMRRNPIKASVKEAKQKKSYWSIFYWNFYKRQLSGVWNIVVDYSLINAILKAKKL